ncbi:MAG: ABC transporter ATP-binding protein/permease [Spongiibacter sp.]|uniref:ABC transporter ATP-binding protein/permease n=1 Tax=Spongiibacter thalassae TaxID=2721624 RepID=A0ABX1GJU7_9GAMM|nr:ABC transporter ATP-binding protein/permease [Spongiibacter thalassae]MDX1505779.1 ABC transporter ATP-binding protein/permease [Spongiibacter sp.]NKI19446.1 ABC transporter ATP-binding protein/permease [Spongiibacter thalassae]
MRGHGHSNYDENQPVSWATLRELTPYLRNHLPRILLALLCLVAAKVASVGLPFALKHIVDFLDTSGTNSLTLVPVALLLAYGGLRFANVLFGELRDTIFGRVTERAMRSIGLTVFKHLHTLDLEFHLNRRTGGLSRDIERGTNGISFLLRFMVFNIVPTFIEIGMVVVLLGWQYSVYYALIVLVAVVSYVAFSVWATEWRTGFIRRANAAESRSSSRAVDSLLNFETVKYFGNEQYEAQAYDSELENWEQARRQNRLSLFALNAGQALIIATALTAAMMLAAKHTLGGEMSIGDFVLINAFMMQIFMPLNFLGFVYREMKGSMANIEAMFALLRQQPRVRDRDSAPDLKVSKGELRFDQVRFNYTDDRAILRDVSFTLPPRHKLAIVGSSGAGKSTILKLLFRFYDTSGGRILIDDQDISQVSQHSLRACLGIVPQDTVLFNQSIRDNIRYGRPAATDGEVDKAIRMAHLDGFIASLPKGADTLVGERGLKLSGGEKQRVAIARAILKDAPIIVFDEATSSLDSSSERAILDAIRDISRNHSMLVIAHRLSTIVDADAILVLDEGRVVEQGRHEDLLAARGHYAHLWAVQQRHDND